MPRGVALRPDAKKRVVYIGDTMRAVLEFLTPRHGGSATTSEVVEAVGKGAYDALKRLRAIDYVRYYRRPRDRHFITQKARTWLYRQRRKEAAKEPT